MMHPSPPPRLRASLAGTRPWLFLSPHLDDAVLSCGALIADSVADRAITVATVFTAADAPPHTRAARSFLRQCSADDALRLFDDRRKEDLEVLVGSGVEHVHLGQVDALFRRRSVLAPVQHLGRVVPEIVHRYPTFRYDIAKGRVSCGDRAVIREIRAQVAELVALTGAELVFCPLGVGRHVDHLITRTVGCSFGSRAVYYSDFPYNQMHEPDAAFLSDRGLNRWEWTRGVEDKESMIRGYRTQADALFPGGHIPAAPELYYAPAADE